MLKKIILILAITGGLSAYAADNYLNSVIIDNADGKTSVVLRSDSIAKVKKEIESPDKIILSIKGISQSPDINTLYKNTSGVNGVVIQNEGNNDIKVYIDAPGISKANVVFDTPNSSPVTVVSPASEQKVLWSIISVILLLAVMRSAKNVKEPLKKSREELIKEREMALYKNFQKEVAAMPSINYKLKSYSKHVLKGETLRHYGENPAKVKL